MICPRPSHLGHQRLDSSAATGNPADMEITPEWVGVMLTLMGMSGATGAWLQSRRDVARHALPIFRTKWPGGPAGFTATIEIVNRLEEDLRVSEVAAAADFGIPTDEYVPATGKVSRTYSASPSPMRLDWLVPAGGSATFSITVNGADTPRWLRLTMSSSHNTLRNKRVTIRPSQSD